MRVYALLLALATAFSAFWIVAVFYVQLIDRKRTAIQVFPQGLNDATALMPLAIAAFAALLFNAQQSVTSNSKRYGWFGKAARRVLGAFYLLTSSFIAGVGARMMDEHTFDGWRLGFFLNQMAKITPGIMFLEGAIAAIVLMIGVWYYMRTMFSRE